MHHAGRRCRASRSAGEQPLDPGDLLVEVGLLGRVRGRNSSSATRPSSTRHRPSSMPSTKTVRATPPFDAHPAACACRARSPGRARRGRATRCRRCPAAATGAGASSSTISPPGTSYTCGRRRPRAGPGRPSREHRAEPGDAGPRGDVGGGRRAERRAGSGARSPPGRARERPAQPAVDAVVDHAARLLPAAARRQLGERHVDARELGRARSAGTSGNVLGQRLAERLHRQRPVRERSLRGGARPRPGRGGRRGGCRGWPCARGRGPAGSTPRSVSASSGASRWMVPRIVSSRTSDRSSRPRLTSYGSKAVRRAASERYGGRFSWACSPTRCATIAATRHRRPLEQVLAVRAGSGSDRVGSAAREPAAPARTDGSAAASNRLSARKNRQLGQEHAFGAQEPTLVRGG